LQLHGIVELEMLVLERLRMRSSPCAPAGDRARAHGDGAGSGGLGDPLNLEPHGEIEFLPRRAQAVVGRPAARGEGSFAGAALEP
jgi:hypothetical protein